jgi:hypothetical protein
MLVVDAGVGYRCPLRGTRFALRDFISTIRSEMNLVHRKLCIASLPAGRED